MPLPQLLQPDGTPSFLAAGHQLTREDPYATVERGSGHIRRRRVRTLAERIVDVSLDLSSDQAQAWDAFYEDTLRAGTLRFSAKVAAEDGRYLWFDAGILETFQADPRPSPTGPRYRISFVLHLRGEGEPFPPSDPEFGFEVVAKLVAVGFIEGDASFGFEVSASLTIGAGFGFEVYANLQVETLGGEELREDGDRELREDGGVELRE